MGGAVMKIMRLLLAAAVAAMLAGALGAQEIESRKAASGEAFGEIARSGALGAGSGSTEAVEAGRGSPGAAPAAREEGAGLHYGAVPAPAPGAGRSALRPANRDKLLTALDVSVGAGIGGLRFGIMGLLAGGMVGLLYGISRHLDSGNAQARSVSDTMTGAFAGMVLLGPSGALPGAELGLACSALGRKKKKSRGRPRQEAEGGDETGREQVP